MRRLLRRSAPPPAAGAPFAAAAGIRATRRRWGQAYSRGTACRGALAYGAFAVVMLAIPAMLHPEPAGPGTGQAQPGRTAGASFRQIILPDLVLVDPHGLKAAQVASIGKLKGVDHVLAVDGARITIRGRPVNVLGVNPQTFRPWTPLRTASDSPLWAALDARQFLASQDLRQRLRLHPGTRYRLAGATPQDLAFGGSGQLGVSGIDVVVSNTASARLGLVHNVAALISAPGLGMRRLEREVHALAGKDATLTDVRPQPLPGGQAAAGVPAAGDAAPGPRPGGSAAAGVRPASYLELFRQSAGLYCPGLSWTVLAAIGQIESGDGANMGPSSAGALGPMQFIPSTWARWGITAFGEKGPPNVMDPYDAVPSAARYLCAAGAAQPGGLDGAIYAYNHADWYVHEVEALAQQYAAQYG